MPDIPVKIYALFIIGNEGADICRRAIHILGHNHQKLPAHGQKRLGSVRMTFQHFYLVGQAEYFGFEQADTGTASHSSKKGRKSMLGYKGFARTDEDGFVDKIHVTSANVGEIPQFGTMINGTKAQLILADKACASTANRAALKGKHRDGILHKAVRGHPLRASEKRFNKLISKCRFRVEQVFGR